MQTHFKKATQHMAHADIVTSVTPPLSGFEPPPIINMFYQQLEQQQAKRGNDVTGGFAFGGMFADVAAGRRPNDIDLYIAVPRLLSKLHARSEEQAYSYREREEREEDMNNIIGFNFPLDISSIRLEPTKTDLFGNHIVGKMHHSHQGHEAILDVIIGEKTISLNEFLPYAGAPIMAVGMTLGGAETEYTYHKDYPIHVREGILCHDDPKDSMLEKAAAKNWAVLSKAEWAERSAKSGRRSDDPSPVFVPA